MKEYKPIEVGSVVDITFNTCESIFEATVMSKPRATGDCWQLKLKDGRACNVIEFCKMAERVKYERS